MKLNDIIALIDKLEDSSINKLIIEEGESYVELSKEASVVMQTAPVQQVVHAAASAPLAGTVATGTSAPAAAPADESGIAYITSPIVGTFYNASSPTSEPFVKVGASVEPGTIVCILEAMKLMNEIESEVSGDILEILVQNEEMVEFGQKLFKVRIR